MALEPITRQEQIIAGKDLQPITRMERFLKKYGGGGGNSVPSDWNAAEGEPGHILNRTHYNEIVDTTLVDGEFTSQFMSSFGVFAIEAFFSITLENIPEKATLVYDGVEYKDLATTYIDAFGTHVIGNMSFLNSFIGASFENTGEPFIATISSGGCGVLNLDGAPTPHSVTLKTPLEVVHRIPLKFMPEMPYFDLTEMGLPDVSVSSAGKGEGEFVQCDISKDDMDRLWDALESGILKVGFTTNGNKVVAPVLAVNGGSSLNRHIVCFTGSIDYVYIVIWNYRLSGEGAIRRIEAKKVIVL